VLLIVVVPTLFWTSVLALLGNALGFKLGSGMLAAFALAVGTLCFIGASLVMAARSDNT
jgi:ABC-type transporter Mla maintaining outer membrane lipid asymmetry permease subunit MlaE